MIKSRFDDKQKTIEQAAMDVFLAQGLENTTLDAVAEKLGYTKQSIYYYYKNKEELITSICLQILEQISNELKQIASDDKAPAEKLAEVLTFFNDGAGITENFFAMHHEMHRYFQKIHNPELKKEMATLLSLIPKLLEGIIKEGMNSGVFRDGNAEVIASILFGMINCRMMLVQKGNNHISKNKITNYQIDILLNGIAKKK